MLSVCEYLSFHFLTVYKTSSDLIINYVNFHFGFLCIYWINGPGFRSEWKPRQLISSKENENRNPVSVDKVTCVFSRYIRKNIISSIGTWKPRCRSNQIGKECLVFYEYLPFSLLSHESKPSFSLSSLHILWESSHLEKGRLTFREVEARISKKETHFPRGRSLSRNRILYVEINFFMS